MRKLVLFGAMIICAQLVRSQEVDKIKLTQLNNLIKSSNSELTIINFWATWCGPCKKLTPILNEVSQEMKDTVHVVKIDTDKNPKTSEKYKITCLPTLLLFKNGELISTEEGFMTKNKIVKWVEKSVS